LLFFGTPFRGARGIDQMLEVARREFDADKIHPEALRTMEPENPYVRDIVDRFCKLHKEAPKKSVFCFYELKATKIGKIVGETPQMVRQDRAYGEGR
jgi:hypothetical protein